MNGSRTNVLEAVSEAANLHRRYPTAPGASFDVIGAAIDLEIPVMYRPLGGLWGATVHVGERQGVLVNTKIGRPVQRFTLAHELGHVLLGHPTSFDVDGFASGRLQDPNRAPEERAANAFASELLASPTLIGTVARQHRWSKDSMNDPARVYQLSLRLGVSFTAMCWALSSMKLITNERAAELSNPGVVKRLKRSLVPEKMIQDPWADVWELTETDFTSRIEAGPFDIFVVRVKEQSSSGFLWEIQSESSPFVLLDDQSGETETFGDSSLRSFFLGYKDPEQHRLILDHHRPWTTEAEDHLDLTIDTRGKEVMGLPRRVRERALAEVA
jgi:Zn-dependent peptidase ImmA (M78 family)